MVFFIEELKKITKFIETKFITDVTFNFDGQKPLFVGTEFGIDLNSRGKLNKKKHIYSHLNNCLLLFQ